LLKIGADAEQDQRARLAALRANRDAARCTAALGALRDGARTTANLLPLILNAARADATLYEIRAAMEDVFGAYREPVFF